MGAFPQKETKTTANEKKKSNLLDLLDTNIIEAIFREFFSSYIIYFANEERGFDLEVQERKKCSIFSEINNFKYVCKIFDNISKVTLFTLNLHQIEFKLPYNLYLKLLCIPKQPSTNEILIMACEKNFYDLIDILIKKGKADINSNWFGFTPLKQAVCNNNIKTTKKLIKYKNLDINSYPCLIVACAKRGSEKMVELLLTRNDLDINTQNPDRYTPLLLAVKGNKKNIVSLLLKRNDLNLNFQKDFNGFNALTLAITENKHDIVSLLLSQKEKIKLNLKNYEQKTALDIAKEGKMINLLRNHEDTDKLNN